MFLHATYPKLDFYFAVSPALELWELPPDRGRPFLRFPASSSRCPAACLRGFVSDSWSQRWDPLGPSVWTTQSMLQQAGHLHCSSGFEGASLSPAPILWCWEILQTWILLSTVSQFHHRCLCSTFTGDYRKVVCFLLSEGIIDVRWNLLLHTEIKC